MPAVGVNLNAASGGIQETDWGQGGQGTLGTGRQAINWIKWAPATSVHH